MILSILEFLNFAFIFSIFLFSLIFFIRTKNKYIKLCLWIISSTFIFHSFIVIQKYFILINLAFPTVYFRDSKMLVYFEILGGILSLIFLSVLIFSSMNYVSNILNLKSHDKEKFYKLYSIIIPIFFIGSLTFVLLKMPANNLSNMSHIIQYQIYPVTCLIIGIVGIVSYNMRKNIENTEVKNEITFISKIYIFTIPFALIDIFLLKDTQVRLSFFSLLPFFIHIYLHLSKYYFLNYENNPSKNKLEINMKSLNFTAREQKIALLIVQGNTYNQIADSLFISINTVKTHVKNIYKKANVSNKIQLTYKLQEDNSCSSNILLSD